MKRNELIIIAIVGFVAAIFSFVVSNAIIGTPNKNPIKVPVVEPISSEFPNPQTDPAYKEFFNENALNPTQLIKIGDKENKNSKPFDKGTTH